jgi:hypothetical protein
MKKHIFIAFFLVAVLLACAIPALAASNSTTAPVTASDTRPQLLIKSPQAAAVGEKVQFRVAESAGGNPAAGAAIWAVNAESNTSLTSVSASVVSDNGILLGYTDETGVLAYAFKQPGRYLLVACKDGYNPGFAWIKITPLASMVLKGPASAYTGQTCEFGVYQTNGGVPVAGAAVWAILRDNLTDSALSNASTEETVAAVGFLMGYTNSSGKLYYAFQKAGAYRLIAFKTGYYPAVNAIKITSLKEMVIRNAATVRTGAAVAIRVVEKSVLTVEIPVAGAGVWDIPQSQTATLDGVNDLPALAKTSGIYLGATDKTGYVSPYPRFSTGGRYWLITIKDGYVPAISQINVISLTTATPVIQNSAVSPGSGSTTSR